MTAQSTHPSCPLRAPAAYLASASCLLELGRHFSIELGQPCQELVRRGNPLSTETKRNWQPTLGSIHCTVQYTSWCTALKQAARHSAWSQQRSKPLTKCAFLSLVCRRMAHLQGLWHEGLQLHILQLQIQPCLSRQNHHLRLERNPNRKQAPGRGTGGRRMLAQSQPASRDSSSSAQ